MERRSRPMKLAACFTVVLAAFASAPAQAQEASPEGFRAPSVLSRLEAGEPLRLSLADCIRRALAKNIDLRIEALNPDINQASLAETKEQFLPQFNVNSSYLNQDIPSTWGVEGPTVSTKRDYYYFDLSERLPTGTEATLSLYTQKTDTSRAFTTVNPSYYSEFRLRVRQPLLRGFGPNINRYEQRKTERQLDSSRAALESTLLQTIFSVEEAYWNLYHARESLRVLEQSLAQSRVILKRNQEAARIGTKSSVEVLSAEAQAASYEDSILSVRLQVRKMENRLKALLDMPIEDSGIKERLEPGEDIPTIILTDRPDIERQRITFEEAYREALSERPEITQAESRIATAALDISFSRNQLLPQLDLNLSFWFPGQSGVRYIFLNDNPLSGVVIDKIVGSRGQSIKDIMKGTYQNVSFDVTLTLPLANLLSRASLGRAKLAQEQARLQFEKQQKAIELEIREALGELETKAQKIETSTHYRELVEKQVAAETKRYELGLVGSEWLFTYQKNLSQAKMDEIRAIIDYKIAQAALDKAMGTSLRTKGIRPGLH